MKTVGITGGIGSGKSTISRFFINEGYPVYDCDTNSKNIANTNQTIKKNLIGLFGKNIYDSNGLLNKKLLADLIFSDNDNRLAVNAIIHPQVINDVNNWIKKQTNEIIFIESALLFDSGLDTLVDKIIFVDADETLRLQRARQRELKKLGLTQDIDNLIEKDIALRIQSQKAQYEYAKQKSDFIITNNNNLIITQLIDCINSLL